MRDEETERGKQSEPAENAAAIPTDGMDPELERGERDSQVGRRSDGRHTAPGVDLAGTTQPAAESAASDEQEIAARESERRREERSDG